MRSLRCFVLVSSLFLPLAGCHSTHRAPEEALPANRLELEPLLAGYQSGLHDAQALVLRDETEWRAIWTRHAGFRIPAASPPAVDFAAHDVLAVFAGDRPSGGYGLEVKWVAPEAAGLVARAITKPPAKGAVVPQVVTQPYALVLLPKTSGAVTLRLD